jgi:hypothetical protein
MMRPSLNRPIGAPRQLLVEGRTAEIFFREWVKALGLTGQLEVRDFGSIAELTSFLKLFVGYKEFQEQVTGLGIIRDAEELPAESGFRSVCDSLKQVGLPQPAKAAAIAAGPPRTGVFILPDCQMPGMLETLCWQLLRSDARLAAGLNCVESFLECLRQAHISPRNEAKAKVWAFLSGKGEFDPQVGRAAQSGIWDWQSPVLQPLGVFLRSL